MSSNPYQNLNDLEQFVLARWFYAIGEPIFEDAEYTYMLNMLKETDPENEYVNRSWSSDPCPVELLRRIGREDAIQKIVLSDKTESIPSLGTDYEVESELGDFEGRATLSMKHDGWNMQASYYNGELITVNSRGRYSDNMNADILMKILPQQIPQQGSVKVVFEATVSFADFSFCSSHFGNVSPRSSVSTVLANPEYVHLISCHAFDIHGFDYDHYDKFDILESWGFMTPAHIKVRSYDEMLDALDYLSAQKATYKWPTDGAVFDGYKRRAIRLRAWEEPIMQSYVTGYIEQYNISRISPSLVIYPILRDGGEQKRINITNWQRIMDFDLQPGSPVAFRIASGAIADFDEEATRRLHKQWIGKYAQFQAIVNANEQAKKWRL